MLIIIEIMIMEATMTLLIVRPKIYNHKINIKNR